MTQRGKTTPVSDKILLELSRELSIYAQKGFLRLVANESGESATTFKLGGPLPYLVEPCDHIAVSEIQKLLSSYSVATRILGGGSNILISDQGINEPIIRLGIHFKGLQVVERPLKSTSEAVSCLTSLLKQNSVKSFSGGGLPPIDAPQPSTPEVRLFVLGGTSLMSLSRKTSVAGLSGLEFSAGIPATIGGAVTMNAGAHGSDMSAIVSSVLISNRRGEFELLSGDAMRFGYRSSALQVSDELEGSIVVGAELILSRGDPDPILGRRRQCLEYRKRTQPLSEPSAGSIFRNPNKSVSVLTAAEMIDSLGYKGHVVGGVKVSDKHANWIVKCREDAKASDVKKLISQIKGDVLKTFNIEIHTELVCWT